MSRTRLAVWIMLLHDRHYRRQRHSHQITSGPVPVLGTTEPALTARRERTPTDGFP
jgi:hypothetical protein